MFRLTLAQMRRSVGRLVAAGLAIAIGTAFVAATLLAGDVLQQTGRAAVTAQYAQADLVVGDLSGEDDVTAIRALPGVAAADAFLRLGVELRTPSEDRWQTLLPAPSDSRLGALRVETGRAPTASGEIALPQDAADAFGVTVGDTLEARWSAPADDGTWEEQIQDVVLVGIATDPDHAWTDTGGAALATLADGLRWSGITTLADVAPFDVVVAAAPGESVDSLRDEIATALPDATAMTRDEAADTAFQKLGRGGDQAMVAVVLGFAAIALVVAGLVIANTFQVLVAQRTRTLALLRAVGARRRQLRASVLLEAVIVGVASSVAGLAAGVALAQGMLAVLRTRNLDVPLPATVDLSWQVVVVPLLVGTAVTVLASLVPARAATRVTAIEALRPLDVPIARTGAGRARAAFSLALTVLGMVGLAGAVWLGIEQEAGMAALGVGLLAGSVSFVGVLLGAVFWVPPVVRLAQRALHGLGPVPRLASANTVRNPRRTAATSTALIIGVTLVALMSTGAASARQSLDRALDEQFPVDLTITPVTSGVDGTPLPARLAGEVAAIDGVSHVVEVRSAYLELRYRDGGTIEVTTRAISPDDAATVMRDPAIPGQLADGALLVPEWFDRAPATVTARLATGGTEPAGAGTTVDTEVLPGLGDALVAPATMDAIAPDAVVDSLFVSLADDADAVATLREVQDALGSADLQVRGPAAERAQYDRVIDVLLAVVIGLLGVAVLIALLGVTNTLSLSVIERRRESATLRAIGLSRRRLRGTLAVEGMLIAGVGAVAGGLLGVLYGWAGAATVLGQLGPVSLAVSWRDLAIVVVVALGAGLLASVLPARSAARTPPVAALAEE